MVYLKRKENHKRILTSYMISICCRVTVVPSSNTKCAGVIRRAAWLNQISKNPTLMRISWSSWPKSQKPGTRLANSTTLCTLGVMQAANCCQSHTRWDSMDSAVELATFIKIHIFSIIRILYIVKSEQLRLVI